MSYSGLIPSADYRDTRVRILLFLLCLGKLSVFAEKRPYRLIGSGRYVLSVEIPVRIRLGQFSISNWYRENGRAIRLATEPVLKTVECKSLGSSTLPPSVFSCSARKVRT